MQSKAKTVQEYLAGLPDDRRAAIEAVRRVIRENMDADIEEGMSYGMIGYCVPHRVYAAGYHCDPRMPLPYAGLASQKGHMSLYLTSVYCGCFDTPAGRGVAAADARNWFIDAWKATGKKLDMGKACIRFKRLEDVPLEVVGEAIRRVPAKVFIEHYERGLGARRTAEGRGAAKRASVAGASTKEIAAVSERKAARKTAKKTAKKAATKRSPAKRPPRKKAGRTR